MSNLQKISEIVQTTRPQFEELARIHGVMNFKEEAAFALQLLQDNDYLARVAAGNPDSLKRAILNVAIIGLSLNPYKRQAYLVPRKGKVCLDIGYVGYVQQAIDMGAIKFAVAELVYENDQFEFLGITQAPYHKFKPFEDRGRKLGGYVITKLFDDSVLVSYMPLDEIHAIRNRSDSWKAYKEKGTNCIWVTDENEMIKKTLIKRARKSWPLKNVEKAAALERIADEADKVLLNSAPEVEDAERIDMVLNIRNALEILDRQESKYVDYLKKINGREIGSLEDLTKAEMREAITALGQLVDQKTAQEMK